MPSNIIIQTARITIETKLLNMKERKPWSADCVEREREANLEINWRHLRDTMGTCSAP